MQSRFGEFLPCRWDLFVDVGVGRFFGGSLGGRCGGGGLVMLSD